MSMRKADGLDVLVMLIVIHLLGWLTVGMLEQPTNWPYYLITLINIVAALVVYCWERGGIPR